MNESVDLYFVCTVSLNIPMQAFLTIAGSLNGSNYSFSVKFEDAGYFFLKLLVATPSLPLLFVNTYLKSEITLLSLSLLLPDFANWRQTRRNLKPFVWT
jgi:hypothetical protein